MTYKKYRAWDLKRKIMLYPLGDIELIMDDSYIALTMFEDYVFPINEKLFKYIEKDKLLDYRNYICAEYYDDKNEEDTGIFMQFVGIIDKNDEELYEGDKIIYKNKKYEIKDIKDFLFWCGYNQIAFIEWKTNEIEKVGNIYED